MKRYPYIHHPSEKLVFLCEAEDILEADKMFFAALGVKPDRLGNVGCRVVGEYPSECLSAEEAKDLLTVKEKS